MTFDDLWPALAMPGEFDAMDQCDQQRWRGVLQQAFDAGQTDAQRTAAVWENEAERRSRRYEQCHAALLDARDCMADWAAYASHYFQEKHDLAGDLERVDAALRA